MAFLLRVELSDVPGSLGTVASALGAAGADIAAIEIVEKRADGRAVDDVLLELPSHVMPDALVSACQQLDGVHVLWISRYAAGANLRLDLETVEALTQAPAQAWESLVRMLPDTFRCDWALGIRRAGAGIEVFAASPAAPDAIDAFGSWLDLTAARRLSVDAWEDTVIAAAPLQPGEVVAVFARRGGPDVLDSELARLSHLAALATLIRSAPR